MDELKQPDKNQPLFHRAVMRIHLDKNGFPQKKLGVLWMFLIAAFLMPAAFAERWSVEMRKNDSGPEYHYIGSAEGNYISVDHPVCELALKTVHARPDWEASCNSWGGTILVQTYGVSVRERAPPGRYVASYDLVAKVTPSCPPGSYLGSVSQSCRPICPRGAYLSKSVNGCRQAYRGHCVFGECPDPNVGEACPKTGNPVALHVANKYQLENDTSVPLGFFRAYNSMLLQDLGLGIGWRHAFQSRIVRADDPVAWPLHEHLPAAPASSQQMQVDIDPDWVAHFSEATMAMPANYRLERPDGRAYPFSLTGQPLDPAAARYRFVVNQDGFRIIEGNKAEYYDTLGRLIRIDDNGRSTKLGYRDDGPLNWVETPNGANLLFHYDSGLKLKKVEVQHGTEIRFTHDTQGRLVSVTHPDQTSRQYHYEDPNPYLLTGITDEAGVRYATWRYNADGEAISSEHAGGIDKVGLAFTQAGSTRTTTETDPLGTNRRYHFTQIGKRWLLTGQDQPGGAGCGPASATLGYDANGNVQSRTDFNGVSTTYGYDLTRNLETTRTEAAGTPQARTVTTTWHPTFRLPATLTEPGRVTTFSYDDQGHLLQKQITADGVTRAWRWTYLPNGLLETATDPLGQLTRYSYDAQGNLATVTNPLNQVTRYPRYDAHGNLLEQIDPDNRSTTFGYDLRQRLILRSAPEGQTRFDYLPTGLLSKVTLPDGSWLGYRYDPAHRLIGIDHSDGSRIDYTLDNAGNRKREDRYDPAGTLAGAQQAVTAAQQLPGTPQAQ